jgi:hypothetical protein
MTNDEAIIDLSVLAERMDSKNAEIPVYDISLEAVDMAIKALSQQTEDAISRQAALDEIISRLGISGEKYLLESERYIYQIIKDLPPVTPKQRTGHCKDCKWWKDSDGLYRRGGHAESQCPINRREVLEGNGYCYMYEPQESEGQV